MFHKKSINQMLVSEIEKRQVATWMQNQFGIDLPLVEAVNKIHLRLPVFADNFNENEKYEIFLSPLEEKAFKKALLELQG